MVLVITGTQNFQFNRLIKAVDDLKSNGTIKDDVFIQIGKSTYIPKHCEYKDFVQKSEMNDLMDKASLIITHGGTGSIIDASKKGKPIIAVTRLAKYGEHVDDHQTEIVDEFNNENFLIGVHEVEYLPVALTRINTIDIKTYTGKRDDILNGIEEIIQRL